MKCDGGEGSWSACVKKRAATVISLTLTRPQALNKLKPGVADEKVHDPASVPKGAMINADEARAEREERERKRSGELDPADLVGM